MVSITDKLEGLLPADGPVTKDERVIAAAVSELRDLWWLERHAQHYHFVFAIISFATGCIASAIFVGWV